uniref:Snurportin-1 n=1 Tax=Panagrellus redivivus TaxID=6233 RepID=A0A7E4VCG1_PANRE
MMACPKGKRCLVVAKDGWTQAFNKAGLLIFESMTGLPGGCSASRHSTTIVDAIRLAADPQTYYILDVIYAQGMSFLEVDALSRFAMIQAIAEEAAINTTSLRPKYRKKALTFLVPPLCRCTIPAMTAMMAVEHPFEIDGLLFYNDKGWYTAGYTPLVGWLKPWMLPEVLGVPVLEKVLHLKALNCEF